MKNSIFTKFITIFLIIIFVAYAALAGIMSYMTVRYANRQRDDVAVKTSELIYNYFSTAKFYPSQTALYQEFTGMLNILSQNAETLSIFLCDKDGKVIYSTDGLEGNITSDSLLTLLNGTETSKVSTTLDDILPSKYNVIVTPLNYGSSQTGSQGALLVAYNPQAVSALTFTTTHVIIISSILVMSFMIVAVYVSTEKIATPLRNMSKATKNFAQGKFDTRIQVKGNDEIAELAKSFNSMAESLANIEYTRSTFLANVSHDLRTPMTTITGFIDGILDGAIPPEKQSHYLEIVAQETRRLSRLVSTLLDISRLESGTRKFELSQFDVCEMARIILISFENKINDKKLDVSFNCSEERINVFSDKDAINQVLYNICDNAVKFSRENGKFTIDISKEKDKALISIYNEGIGISAEDLPHVFDRFYKSDISRGLDKNGVGLGMYISKTIMDNLSEKLDVESVPNEYCKFILTINLA